MLNDNFFFKLLINLRCELIAILRSYQELLYPLLFLILVIILFPLSISTDPILLEKISSGIFWVIILFLVLLMLSCCQNQFFLKIKNKKDHIDLGTNGINENFQTTFNLGFQICLQICTLIWYFWNLDLFFSNSGFLDLSVIIYFSCDL